MNKKIYVVLTQTGTLLSRITKKVTGAKYNHVSISTDEYLENMYSFGRVNAYISFIGGFVKESPNFGTFKRFKNTDALILCVNVSEKQHLSLCNYLKVYFIHKKSLSYNYKGLFFAGFGKIFKKRHRYYCSEFVKDVLVKAKVIEKESLPEIVHPMDFLKLFGDAVVFKGKLSTYALAKKFRTNFPVFF